MMHSRVQRVDNLILLGRFAEAEAAAREGLAEEPDSAFLKVMLARTLLRQNRLGPAADVVNAAIASNPEFAYAYRIKGVIHQASGFRSEADNAFTKALEIDPYDELSYLQRAYLDIHGINVKSKTLRKAAQKTKFVPNLARARQDLDEAIRLAPERAAILVGFAELHAVQGNYGHAESAAKRALVLDPQSAAAHEVLGMLAEQSNNVRAASEHYVAAGRADPTDSAPLDRLRKLGKPALVVPWVGLYIVIKLAQRGARVGTGWVIGIVAIGIVVGIGWLVYASMQKRGRSRFRR